MAVPLPRGGIGVDIHALAAEESPRPLWLAGLRWEEERGLDGHSDGGAASHAACDALFSAAGNGDLGAHFCTGRPELAEASGTRLLAEAARRVRETVLTVRNISIQVIRNRPLLSLRREEACQVLSRAAGAAVSVSGTTADGLGLTGRGEGVAAVATALVIAQEAQ